MGATSRGRGAAATFGLLLLLAGIAGAAVLWVMADRRPEQAVEGFARGPVGCTTTLEFSDIGTFYLYEETVAADSPVFDECAPSATIGSDFGVELRDGGRALAARTDTSITYDTADAIGASIARVEIASPGRYDLVVRGPDTTVVAAVGRDPDDGVAELRRGAIVVGAVGVVLGALMLLLAGRRSKRAATFATPAGPGWLPEQRPGDAPPAWPPVPPRVPQLPVPPDRPVAPAAPPVVPPSAPAAPTTSPWGAPRAEERKDPPPPDGSDVGGS